MYITDAQYTYVDLPYDVRPYNGGKYSYYYNLCGAGNYFGRTKNSSPYNKACYQHFDEAAWKQNLKDKNNVNANLAIVSLPSAFSRLWGF